MKKLLISAAITVAFFFSIAASAAPLNVEEALADRVLGDPDAPVTIIEYSSLTCPHCRHFHLEILPEIKKNYIDTGKVKLIYRDFPFDQLGLLATVMTRCAPAERYFGFLDVLFQQQGSWSRSKDPMGDLSRIGKLGGLNPSDFEACLKNQALVDGLVQKRLDGQKKFDVNATPTFIIDGDHKIVGSQPYEDFDKILSKRVK
ncbi:MAG: DsbA family protein [Rickettsiales bacterium]